MKAEIKTVTPDLATAILNKNTKNRSISYSTVKRYAEMMRQGEFRKTHQSIGITTSGELIDGQHRLMAVEKSGVPIEMVIVYDLDESTYEVTDLGKKRDVADRLLEHRRVADVASFIVRMSDGTGTKPNLGRLKAVRDMVKGTAMDAHVSVKPKQRPFGKAACRTAFVVSVDSLGFDKDYAFSQYKALCHYDFDEMSTASRSLCQRLAKGEMSGHSFHDNECLCYAVSLCLNPDGPKSVSVSTPLVEKFVRDINEHYS